MKREDLDEAAALVLEKVPADSPRTVDLETARALLLNAYEGSRP
jgi:hypothetical protein